MLLFSQFLTFVVLCKFSVIPGLGILIDSPSSVNPASSIGVGLQYHESESRTESKFQPISLYGLENNHSIPLVSTVQSRKTPEPAESSLCKKSDSSSPRLTETLPEVLGEAQDVVDEKEKDLVRDGVECVVEDVVGSSGSSAKNVDSTMSSVSADDACPGDVKSSAAAEEQEARPASNALSSLRCSTPRSSPPLSTSNRQFGSRGEAMDTCQRSRPTDGDSANADLEESSNSKELYDERIVSSTKVGGSTQKEKEGAATNAETDNIESKSGDDRIASPAAVARSLGGDGSARLGVSRGAVLAPNVSRRAALIDVGGASHLNSAVRTTVTKIKETICTNSALPFLKCAKRNGEFLIQTGMFGAGVKAFIINDQRLGIEVFKNCDGRKDDLSRPLFNDACRLDPQTNRVVAVFLKILNTNADLQNMLSSDGISAYVKEVGRTRGVAELTVRQHPISPPVYDLRDLATREVHPLQKTAYLQGFLDGMTAEDLYRQIDHLETKALLKGLSTVAQRIATYDKTKSPQDAEAIQQAVKKAHVDIFNKTRLKLKLTDTVLLAALDLWDIGLVHCDLHFNNVMFLRSYYTDLDKLRAEAARGETVVSATFLRHDFRPSQPNQEYPVFRLRTDDIRFIDTAFMFNTGVDSVAAAPCFINRGERNEDLAELWRGGIAYLFTSPKTQRISRVVTRLAEAIPTAWEVATRVAPATLQDIKTTWLVAQKLVYSIRVTLSKSEELANCRQQRSLATPYVKKLIREFGDFRAAEARMQPELCNLSVLKTGVRKMRKIINLYSSYVLPPESLHDFEFERAEEIKGTGKDIMKT